MRRTSSTNLPRDHSQDIVKADHCSFPNLSWLLRTYTGIMFSMSVSNQSHALSELRSILPAMTSALLTDPGHRERDQMRSAWPELNALIETLPEGVTELRARGLGVSTLALTYVHAARGLCAWVDPEATLYAPALVQAGIDMDRLLVVRPPEEDARRIATKVVLSEAFDLVVIDMRALTLRSKDDVFVRKLTLTHTRTLLLTDAYASKRTPWPTALAVEVSRNPSGIHVRVVKERHGRIGQERTLRGDPFAAVEQAA
jgi:hypothetical protein